MKQYKNLSRQAFDRQAESYDSSAFSRHAKKLHSTLLAQLGQIPRDRVLDVGCGTGELLRQILQRWPEVRCSGVDLSPRMADAAREKLAGRADILVGDAEALPFPAGRFDALLCIDSFHHYPNPHQALDEFRRVLRPGGVLLLADPTVPAGLRTLFNLLLPLSHEGDVHLYSPAELTGLLSRHFRGARCRPAGHTSLFGWGIR